MVEGEAVFDAPRRDLLRPPRPRLDALPSALRWLETIIASTDDAIISLDLDDRITTWNAGAERMYGYSAAEAIGQLFAALLVHPDHHDERSHLMEQVRAGACDGPVEVLRRHKDGRLINVAMSVAALTDAAGDVVGVAAIGQNISARTQAERELQARTLQQAAVADLGQRALATAELATLMDEAVALVARTLTVDLCALLEVLPDGTALRFRATRGWRAEAREHGRVPTGATSQAGYTLQLGAPVIVEDLRTETRFRANDLLRAHGAVSGVTVIVPGHGRPYGILSVHTRQARTFTPDDVHFLTAVGNVLAAAIGRARAHELLEQRVAERTRELSALLEIAHTVASTLDLAPLLGLILDHLQTVVAYTGAAIFVVEGDDVCLLDYRGPLPQGRMRDVRIPLAQAIGYQAVRDRNGPVIVDDLAGDSPLAQGFQGLAAHLRATVGYARSMLIVPLTVKDRLIGVVRIDHHAPHAYTPRHAELALAVATQAAVAIENARLYGRAQEAAMLEERQRLARDLHDAVTQSLYGATLYAEAAARLLATGDHATAAAYVQDVGEATQEALREMRLLLFELRPPDLARDGLAAALRARLAAVEGRVPGLSAVAEMQDDLPLPPPIEEALYGVAREALNNALKHADARQIHLLLRREGAAVVLEIADDGGGFDPAAVAQGGGFGLRGMTERVAQVGGVLAVQSTPGQGTMVRVEVTP